MLTFSPPVHTLLFDTSRPFGLKILIPVLSSVFAAESGVALDLSDPPTSMLVVNCLLVVFILNF